MKTFKQLKNEIIEGDYESAWQKVKRGASELGSGAAEAGKEFISKDLPVLVKKGEEAYEKTKPVVKKVVGAAGKTVEQGGRAVKQWAAEDIEELIDFLSDESIDESLRHDVLDELMEDDGAIDALRSGIDSATFGQGKKATAWIRSKVKGTDYENELKKETDRLEKGEEKSPYASMAGDIAGGILNPFAGAYDLGKTAGEMANKIPSVNKFTDKIGKGIADAIDDSPEVNRAITRPPGYVPPRLRDQPQQQQNENPPIGPVNIEPKVPTTKPSEKSTAKDQSPEKSKQDFKSKESVMNIQRELNKRGANLKVDGIVGKHTANAVRNLQKDLNKGGAGLKVDGDYGQQTDAALKSSSSVLDKIKKYRSDGISRGPYKIDPNKPKPDIIHKSLPKIGKDDGMMPKSSNSSSPFLKKTNYL